jgi:hypothetical protein
MEMTNVEVKAVEQVAFEAESKLKELGELQFALLGGGMGDIVLA